MHTISNYGKCNGWIIFHVQLHSYPSFVNHCLPGMLYLDLQMYVLSNILLLTNF